MTRPDSECRVGIIGGTGLGDALQVRLEDVETITRTTPFGDPAAPLLRGMFEGAEVVYLARHGAGHRFSPSQVPYKANIAALKLAGCTHVVASGATGSLRDFVEPGSVMICDQFIDRTVHRPRTFFDDAAVHVEFAQPSCPIMRGWLIEAAERIPDLTVHPRGTYVCMEGPAFSTRAESRMHRFLGGDVIGMTAMPEARLAREAELAWAMVALPTDFDCWRDEDDEGTLLSTITANLERATAAALAIVHEALQDTTPLRDGSSPAHSALQGAIWSSPTAIGPASARWLNMLRPGS